MNELEICDDLEPAMRKLGDLLAAHVRREEREFFEMLQDSCPEHTLLLLHFPHTESR